MPIDSIQLTAEQSEAVKRIIDTDAIAIGLTGPAGCGKSTVIRHLMRERRIPVCATTGKAAANIGGCTVDAMFALDRKKWEVWNKRYLDSIMLRIADSIIIDESSMIGANMARLLYKIANDYGKRLILVGDWAQAMPVLDPWPIGSDLFKGLEMIKLTECHRQSQGEFLNQLNKVRVGQIDDAVRACFGQRVREEPPFDEGWLLMFGTNLLADDYNFKCLREHMANTGHKAFGMEARFTDLRPIQKKMERPRTQAFIDNVLEDMPFANGEAFALGCQVILTINDPNGRFVNGDTGTLQGGLFVDGTEITGDIPSKHPRVAQLSVLVDRTEQVEVLNMFERETPGPHGEVLHRVDGFPVRLGPAVTIHRAQGMTVDKAWFDMSSIRRFPRGSRHGLAYVALSRTRTLDGLYIDDWCDDVVECADEIRALL